MNAGSHPNGGGKRVEHRRFVNGSLQSGKSPDQLIAEHDDK
jgi:hypothetical protein